MIYYYYEIGCLAQKMCLTVNWDLPGADMLTASSASSNLLLVTSFPRSCFLHFSWF